MRSSARFGGDLSQWFDIWSVEEPTEKEELQLNGLRDSTREIYEIVLNEVLDTLRRGSFSEESVKDAPLLYMYCF